jgi:hypothetical protein
MKVNANYLNNHFHSRFIVRDLNSFSIPGFFDNDYDKPIEFFTLVEHLLPINKYYNKYTLIIFVVLSKNNNTP